MKTAFIKDGIIVEILDGMLSEAKNIEYDSIQHDEYSVLHKGDVFDIRLIHHGERIDAYKKAIEFFESKSIDVGRVGNPIIGYSLDTQKDIYYLYVDSYGNMAKVDVESGVVCEWYKEEINVNSLTTASSFDLNTGEVLDVYRIEGNDIYKNDKVYFVRTEYDLFPTQFKELLTSFDKKERLIGWSLKEDGRKIVEYV